MISERRKHLARTWEGNNTFLFGGRCMLGPDWKALTASVVLMTAPVIAYLATVGIDLGGRLSWAFEVTCACGYTAMVMALFATATTDPGVVPRGHERADPEMSSRGTNPMTKEYRINGRIVKTKYCLTCRTYRPPRCSHCRVCDNCVEKFDHHCPWVGTCIGKRNYRFFMMFVSSATFMCVFTVASCLLWILLAMEDHGVTFWDSMKGNIAALVLGIYCFVFFWFVGGLLMFHIHLLVTNQTTYEHFRATSTSSHINPYNTGIRDNCRQGICTSYQSLLDIEALPPAASSCSNPLPEDSQDDGVAIPDSPGGKDGGRQRLMSPRGTSSSPQHMPIDIIGQDEGTGLNELCTARSTALPGTIPIKKR